MPKLGLGPLIAKIDTGARTAALHAEDIIIRGSHVRFAIPNDGRKHHYELPIKGQRRVKSTSGHSEMRAVVETDIAIGLKIHRRNYPDRPHRHGGSHASWGAPPFAENSSFIPGAHSSFRAPNGNSNENCPADPQPQTFSHQRLMETAIARGHEIVPVDYLRCYMNITSRKPELRYLGEKLTGFDAVIPRIAASHTFYGLAVLRQFEMMGVYPLNESVAIGRSRDKLRSLQILSREGVGMPVTAFAKDTSRTHDVLEIVGGAPVVIKLLEGTQGIGVVLAETEKSAKSVIDAFNGVDIAILVQEFIKESEGRDIRAFCGGQARCGHHGTLRRQGRFPLEPASRRKFG